MLEEPEGPLLLRPMPRDDMIDPKEFRRLGGQTEAAEKSISTMPSTREGQRRGAALS
jgi:hypothetical protein